MFLPVDSAVYIYKTKLEYKKKTGK